MPSRPTVITAIAVRVGLALSEACAQPTLKAELPKPDHADVTYGPLQRNVFDLWLPRTGSQPRPLVIFIHGGGFRQGDKTRITAGVIKEYLGAGWAVASLNYRLTNTAPAPAAYLDCARALQYLRHHAAKWTLDPRRVALTGSSAGAGTSLWIAFHDDLADPKSADPISRQSTRVSCVVVTNAQSSYDPRFAERAGIPRPNFERHDFFLPFYGINKAEIDTPRAYQRYESAAPITYLSREDPPVLLRYGFRNEKVSTASDLGLVVHHPLLGIALKREMDKLGIECIVQYKGSGDDTVQEPPATGQRPVTAIDFIRKHFEGARSSKSAAGSP